MLKYFYIYDYKQASFLLQRGARAIEMGKGKKNDIFLKFFDNEKLRELLDEWKQIRDNVNKEIYD